MSRKSTGASTSTASGCTFAILGLLAVPFYLYLTHEVLAYINADEHLWLLYWIYVTISLVGFVFRAVKEAIDNLD